MDDLSVDSDQAYTTSHLVSNEAEEVREALTSLQRDWDNLSRGWTGVASSGYGLIWAEWVDGANTLVDSLAESSRELGVAAVQYSEQDAASATALHSTPIDLGL